MAETNKLWISILGSGKSQIILLICANKETNFGFSFAGIDVLDYLNDWLGWFYSGYSGFHPFQKII